MKPMKKKTKEINSHTQFTNSQYHSKRKRAQSTIKIACKLFYNRLFYYISILFFDISIIIFVHFVFISFFLLFHLFGGILFHRFLFHVLSIRFDFICFLFVRSFVCLLLLFILYVLTWTRFEILNLWRHRKHNNKREMMKWNVFFSSCFDFSSCFERMGPFQAYHGKR